MAVNEGSNNNNNHNWQGDEKAQPQANQKRNNAMGMGALFSQTSVTTDNRNIGDVQEVMLTLRKFYEGIQESTTADIQKRIIPTIENMTPTISPILPGLILHANIGDKLYVMGVLFSTPALTFTSHQIHVASNGGNTLLSVPLTPTEYADSQVIEEIKNHYNQQSSMHGATEVNLIGMIVVDLEMYKHSEFADGVARVNAIKQFISTEWEESIFVRAAEEIAEAGGKVPTPFKDGKAYGTGGAAEARVHAVSGRVNSAKQLSPSNMEIIASTVNPNRGFNHNNAKEICRVNASVSLVPVSYQEHLWALQNSGQGVQQMNPSMMAQTVYPHAYRPLRPVITLDQVVAGEQLNFNGGLYPFFYGLYLMMITNNNYVFAEALRRQSVGGRGNLSDLEIMIENVAKLGGLGGVPTGAIRLDAKNMADVEVVTRWIHQNVAPHATFQTNLITRGVNSSVNNFLLHLASSNQARRSKAYTTLTAVLDTMTNGKYSEIIGRNQNSGKGWTLRDPVLHQSSIISVNGIGNDGNKRMNLQEFDDMALCHAKGKNGFQQIHDYKSVVNGLGREDDWKLRCNRMRALLSETVFDGDIHFNSFSQVGVFEPTWMAVLGEAMDSIGEIQVSNNMGTFNTSNLLFTPGAALTTFTSIGSNNPTGPVFGGSYAMNQPIG